MSLNPWRRDNSFSRRSSENLLVGVENTGNLECQDGLVSGRIPGGRFSTIVEIAEQGSGAVIPRTDGSIRLLLPLVRFWHKTAGVDAPGDEDPGRIQLQDEYVFHH